MDSAYLIVQVSSRPCALALQPGMEVLRLPELQAQPLAAAGLLGLAEIRGHVTPVLDLRVLLGLPADAASSAQPSTRLVMVCVADRPVALAVEAVIGVRWLAPDQLETIALPQAGQQTVGHFDVGFAHLIGTAGLVPAGLLPEAVLSAEAGLSTGDAR